MQIISTCSNNSRNQGRCQNCACVKRGNKCSSCNPLRNDNCHNQQIIDQPTANRTANHGETTDTPATRTYDQEETNDLPPPDQGDRLETRNHHPPNNPDLELSSFTPMTESKFNWNETKDGPSFVKDIQTTYCEIIQWRHNTFSIPSGKTGTEFINELSRLFRAYEESTAMESIALTTAMIMPSLLLHKPHPKAKVKEHIKYLDRRMTLWKAGDIPELLREGTIIQQRIKANKSSTQKQKQIARGFSRLMMHRCVNAALKLLSKAQSPLLDLHQPLDTNGLTSTPQRTVLDELKAKHPTPQEPKPENLLTKQERDFHPVIFEAINAELIRKSTLKTNGAAGPSGMDATSWKRMCTSFRHASDNMCNSLALVAQKISSSYIDPKGLTAFVACRLIAIDKQPGVRPIGIGEVPRRIISKAIISIIGEEIKEVAGTLQLCAGQDAGCEAGVHSTRLLFEDDESEAILLVDATNAFNTLYRRTALLNIHKLCPSLAITLTNTYRQQVDLHIQGETISSSEGTTQGDPLASAMYALATIPLIRQLKSLIKQMWFADDASATGKLIPLSTWWNKLNQLGPTYGYYPNPSKTWIITKEEHRQQAEDLFIHQGVSISISGRKHLGAAIGQEEFVTKTVKTKIEDWCKELNTLSDIAHTEPHAAYSGFIHGLKNKWSYIMRTVPCLPHFFNPLENIIRNRFIPAITGRKTITDIERDLFALPSRLGGLGIINPANTANFEYQASIDITNPLVSLILDQNPKLEDDTLTELKTRKAKTRSLRREQQANTASQLNLPESLKQAKELAMQRGASNWLTTLPLVEYGFSLHKGDFRDALCLRYGWLPERLPTKCTCLTDFSIEHALNCPRGGFPTLRHNEIRNLTSNLLAEVCHDVSIEPELQSLEGESLNYATSNKQDQARADIKARNVWTPGQAAFFDAKVFNPSTKSNKKLSLPSCFQHHERIKLRAYEQRINEVEHGTFTPLIFSTNGGMGRLSHTFYKRLASLLAMKRHQPYAITMGWLRCHLSYSLLRSAILCIRGSRSHTTYTPKCPQALDLAVTEARAATL